MPCWTRNALQDMEHKLKKLRIPMAEKEGVKEYIKFLKSMMTDRLASYGSHDVTNAKRIKRRSEKVYKGVGDKRQKLESSVVSGGNSSSPSSEADPDWTPCTSHARTVKVGTTPDLI